jgi:hypothetical protein
VNKTNQNPAYPVLEAELVQIVYSHSRFIIIVSIPGILFTPIGPEKAEEAFGFMRRYHFGSKTGISFEKRYCA